MSLERLRRSGPSPRGAATVEVALVAPLLVVMAVAGMYLTDIARAKLKLQEATRYVAWEMTSFTLSDHGHARHAAAFESARRRVVEEAQGRYRDLDSVEDAGRFSFLVDVVPPEVQVENRAVPFLGEPPASALRPGGAPQVLLRALDGGASATLERYGFDTHGKVEVSVASSLAHPFPVPRLLQRSDGRGQSASHLTLRSRLTLVASGWHLPDGGDHTFNTRLKQAGMHGDRPGALRAQLERMVYSGMEDALPGPLRTALGQVDDFLPLPTLLSRPVFVVSHNYGPHPRDNRRNCNTPVHSAPNGMSNLDRIDHGGPRDLLDQKRGEANDWMRCFDTAPFRDTDDHTRSLYQRIFESRGPYFMGCKNAQADDPTSSTGSADLAPGDPGPPRVPCQ